MAKQVRKINARALSRDIRAGIGEAGLRSKYGISPQKLTEFVGQLVEHDLLTREDARVLFYQSPISSDTSRAEALESKRDVPASGVEENPPHFYADIRALEKPQHSVAARLVGIAALIISAGALIWAIAPTGSAESLYSALVSLPSASSVLGALLLVVSVSIMLGTRARRACFRVLSVFLLVMVALHIISATTDVAREAEQRSAETVLASSRNGTYRPTPANLGPSPQQNQTVVLKLMKAVLQDTQFYRPSHLGFLP